MNAIILAAGMGTRLRPLTNDRPKCLVEVNGIPMVERQIHFLKEKGIEDITLISGYKAEALNFLKDKYGVDVFALDSTPRIKSIQKGQIFIEYNNIICDFTDLGLPPHENVYKDRTFKYVFIERKLYEDNPSLWHNTIIEDIHNLIKDRYEQDFNNNHPDIQHGEVSPSLSGLPHHR